MMWSNERIAELAMDIKSLKVTLDNMGLKIRSGYECVQIWDSAWTERVCKIDDFTQKVTWHPSLLGGEDI